MRVFYDAHLWKDKLSSAESLDCGLFNGPSRGEKLGLHWEKFEGFELLMLLLMEDFIEEVFEVRLEDDVSDALVLDQIDSNAKNVHNFN